MSSPILIFLHGLLGTQADWQKVIEKLPHFDCISLDLPWHGNAKRKEKINDFESTCQYLAEKIKTHCQNRDYFLVGYSLGGRIALYYALQAKVDKTGLQGLILEGANLGLSSDTERQARWQQDQYWAMRFASESAQSVLDDWYQQAVFSHLNRQQRTNLIQQRSANCGKNIGKMLLATSLAKQPNFAEQIHSANLALFYFCGEYDQKFRQLAQQHQLNLHLILGAGHNAHQENPTEFADKLTKLLSTR